MRTIKTWLATTAVLLCSITVSAHDFEVNGIYYNITSTADKTVEVTFRGSASDSYSDEYYFHETIPSTVTSGGITYTVTAIGECAFLGCSGVTGITIPNTVTSIGWRAFYNCTKLTDITLPNSLKNINGYAFGYCESLTTITIPENVTTIREGAFSGCTSLSKYIFNAKNMTSTVGESESGQYIASLFNSCDKLTTITIGTNVKRIPAYAFYQCKKITKITIPENITSIGNSAFNTCSSLREVTFNAKNCASAGSSDYPIFDSCNNLITIKIGENVQNIPNYAFYGCTKITSITIPNSVTSLGAAALGKCTGLTSVSLPNTITAIPSSFFVGCTSLSSISIPNTVTEISSAAFSGCSALTDITIPKSVKYIRNSAFNGCAGITNIEIPESITDIESSVFSGCTGLTSITIPNNVTTIGNSSFEGCSSITSIEIPNSITEIGSRAFKDCTSLVTVNIPNTITTLNEVFRGCTSLKNITIPNSVTTLVYTFYDCKSLTDIVIPNSVTQIGSGTFRNCTSLKNLTIPSSVSSIGWDAVSGCTSLTSVTIPEGIKELGSSVFHGCSALTEVICKSPTPATVNGNTFYGTPYATLYVPKGSKDKYANAEVWKWFENIIEYSLIPEYTITYIVDGKEWHSTKIEHGAEIPAVDAPSKDGYTFSGWEGMPLNMPDKDVTVYAKFIPNKYTVTFKAYGKVVSSESLDYGTAILAPEAPEIEDYAFVEWTGLLETVPARDVEFNAVYKQVGFRITDGVDSFEQNEDIPYERITYTRTLSKTNTWNALYVPFEIPMTAEFCQNYDVAYFNDIHCYDNYIGEKENGVLGKDGVIDGMDMEVLTVQEGSVLNANYPYLIRAKNANALNMNIKVEDATLYKSKETTVSCSSVFMKFDVTGIYTTQTAGELKGEFDVYAMSGGGWKQALNPAQQLKPFRLYLKLSTIDGSPVKVAESALSRINIRVDGEDTETGILEMEGGEELKNEIFDLSGRRVQNAQKGMYIVNGKKVIK